ncbi:4927_t:CDS:2, partial [Racocetra fulgida]
TPFTIAKSAKKHETNILANEKLASSNTTSLDNMISLDGDQVISLSENNSDNEFSSDYEEPKPKGVRLLKENLKWNPIWEITYPWLRLGEKKEKSALFCKLCESAKLNNNFVTDKLQISLEIGFTNQLGTSHLSVIRNLVNTYWLAKNLVATSKITDLTSLTKYHVKCTEEIHTPLEIYTLDHLLFKLLEESQFIDAIGRVIEEAVCQEIQESP